MVENRDRNHHVSVSVLSDRARKRLKDLNLEDMEELFSLRLSGKERIWGILTQGVLEVLWWDPAHEVCPSSKKHAWDLVRWDSSHPPRDRFASGYESPPLFLRRVTPPRVPIHSRFVVKEGLDHPPVPFCDEL